MTENDQRRHTQRPATLDDLPQINRLLDRVWFSPRSPAGFKWLFADNPGQSGLPGGWVVENPDGQICAYLGNFVQRAWQNGTLRLIASGHTFVAAPGQGGRAMRLLRLFLRQPEPAILAGLNANPISARIYAAMKLDAYPETGAMMLSWMANPVIATRGAISWRAHALTGYYFARRVPGIPQRKPDVDALLARGGEDITRIVAPLEDTRLAAFDTALRNGPRLFTERSPAALAWRLSDPDAELGPVLLAYPSTGPIRGLALFRFNKPSEAGPPFLDVIDLVTLDEQDHDAAQRLLKAGLGLARRAKMARLRLLMITPPLLRLLGPLVDKARKTTGAMPFAYYKAQMELPDPVYLSWQPLPYDGDHGPSLRPLPVRPA